MVCAEPHVEPARGPGEWTSDQIATYLKTGAYKGKTVAVGPMAEVVQNSLSHMTDADLKAMVEYLKSLPANSSRRAARRFPMNHARGAALYIDNCSGCHQAKGRGILGVYPPLAGNGVVTASDSANILKVVLGGIPARNGYMVMPSLAGHLNDQQIADIANYIRTSWGNSATPNATSDGGKTARDNALNVIEQPSYQHRGKS